MKVKKYYNNRPQPIGLPSEDEACPIEYIMKLIRSKGSLLIVQELLKGKRRTYELVEALAGMSSKTLTMRLRMLEKYGIIRRQVYPEIPPHVEYSLTQKGRELQAVIQVFKQVGERLMEQEE